VHLAQPTIIDLHVKKAMMNATPQSIRWNRTILSVICTFTLLLVSTCCCATIDGAAPDKPGALHTEAPEIETGLQLGVNLKLLPLTDAINDLNGRLLRRLAATQPQNCVYSPIAIAIPLAMILSGARNRTQRELWQALGLANSYQSPSEVSKAFQSVNLFSESNLSSCLSFAHSPLFSFTCQDARFVQETRKYAKRS
jgi:serine protease inhibitor